MTQKGQYEDAIQDLEKAISLERSRELIQQLAKTRVN